MTSTIGQTVGIFRFIDPDTTVPASERAIYSGPAPKEVREVELPLYDVRTATDITSGAKGLDVQGFTYIEHRSSLSSDEIIEAAEAKYAQECIDLVLQLTGASRGVVHNLTFRRRPPTRQKSYTLERKGGEVDQAIAKLPRDRILVNGRDDNTQEPAGHAHCDMDLDSLRDTLHMCRKDISAAGKTAWEAERQKAKGENVKVPRYAAFSVWRPLKIVKRDPIAVLDWRIVDKDELADSAFRCVSEMTDSGDYVVNGWVHKPPKNPSALKWYWMSNQTPDDVLIIKFADSASAEDESIAAGCIHCSPVLPGTENEEARCSVETRVYAFWD